MECKKIIIMGAGFSSLSASCYLAKMGYEVTILEKNDTVGGRARQLKKDGFTFDIGPSFYWMPDVFDRFFGDFGKKTSDYYQLDKLNPGYQAYFGKKDSISIADNFEIVKETFEKIEKGSGQQLQKFIDQAETNYNIAIKDLVYKPGENIFEIVTKDSAKQLWQFFSTIKKEVEKHVKNPNLKKILEFPVLFLGAKPSNTPAFYSFMNYADLKLGTWHPQGGMYKVVEGMASVAKELGVKIITNKQVSEIVLADNMIKAIKSNEETYPCDLLLSGADYEHTESLLPENLRQYSAKYWDKKTFAPSALLFYVGFDKKIEQTSHHTLFFDASFDKHAATIYDTKEWPEDPLFYVSFPSKTDNSCAPEGKEAAVFLIPLAPDLEDTEELRDKYFNIVVDRLEKNTEQTVKEHILFKESYCVNEFKEDYNAYKGNAYGLANTILQTHILRPKLRSKKVKNLYFTGQLTVPGPGVPPSLISGKIVSDLINKKHSS
jgi:phytoene desaturase